METMLIIKMGIFVALEVFVVGTIGAVLILGLRGIVEFRIKIGQKTRQSSRNSDICIRIVGFVLGQTPTYGYT
jgi:hypothetical protein